MKSKVIIAVLSILATIFVACAVTVFINPIIATEILNNINGVTEPPTTIAPTTSEITTTQKPTEPPTVQSLQKEKGDFTLEVNTKIKLKPQIEPNNAENKKLYFSSTDENIATVSVDGQVTGLSKGKCNIEVVSDSNNKVTTHYAINVTDKRIEQIDKLNKHLASIKNPERVKKENIYISKAVIDDFNNDENFELIIMYSFKNNNVLEFAKIKDDKIVSAKTYENFNKILDKNYTSYNQELYTDNKGNLYIKSTSTKNSSTIHTREVEFYSIDESKMKIDLKSNYKDIYTYKVGKKTPHNSEFYIDDEKVLEEPYLNSLSNYFDGYILYEKLVDKYIDIHDTKYIKVMPIINLGDEYNNRIKWNVKDDNIVTVNSSGMITAKNTGETIVYATTDFMESNINEIIINVTNPAKHLTNYLNTIKHKKIKSENNETLTLYGSKLLDVNNDTKLELALYYKGKTQSQIDIVKENGSKLKRDVAINRKAKNGYTLNFEIYINNSNGEIVIQENQSKAINNTTEVEFYFNKYIEKDKKYSKESDKHKVVSTNKKITGYYIKDKKLSKEEFEIFTKHYDHYKDWDII